MRKMILKTIATFDAILGNLMSPASARPPFVLFRSVGVWAIAALTASLFAVPAAHSATELFSANLAGENEVPPINTAGSATFHMDIGSTPITFSLAFSGLSANPAVAHLHFAPTKVHRGRMICLC